MSAADEAVNHATEFSSYSVVCENYGCEFAFGGADPESYRLFANSLLESAECALNVLARNVEAPDPIPPDWEKGVGSALHGVSFMICTARALMARAGEEDEAKAK